MPVPYSSKAELNRGGTFPNHEAEDFFDDSGRYLSCPLGESRADVSNSVGQQKLGPHPMILNSPAGGSSRLELTRTHGGGWEPVTNTGQCVSYTTRSRELQYRRSSGNTVERNLGDGSPGSQEGAKKVGCCRFWSYSLHSSLFTSVFEGLAR